MQVLSKLYFNLWFFGGEVLGDILGTVPPVQRLLLQKCLSHYSNSLNSFKNNW
jgi:hypothetical protein